VPEPRPCGAERRADHQIKRDFHPRILLACSRFRDEATPNRAA
jgi:hypothetical protein